MQYLIQSTFPNTVMRMSGGTVHISRSSHARHIRLAPAVMRVTDGTRDPRALFGHLLQAPAVECVMGYPRERIPCACQHRTIMHCSPNPLLTP